MGTQANVSSVENLKKRCHENFLDDDDNFNFINLLRTLPVVGAASGQKGLAPEEVEEDAIFREDS